jgi:hypothetical protein
MSESLATRSITFEQGDRWICQNSNCGAGIIVVTSSALMDGENPRCTCGSSFSNLVIACTQQQLALRALMAEMARPPAAVSAREDTPAGEELAQTKKTAG